MECVDILLTFISYLILSVSGVVLFKLGNSKTPVYFSFFGEALHFQISLLSVLGLLCYCASFIIYMLLITKNKLIYLVPIATGSTYVLTMCGSVLIFKDKLTGFGLLGGVLILTGIFVVGFGG